MKEDRYARIGIALMASGEGRRFGSNKLLANAGSKLVVERTLDAIRSCQLAYQDGEAGKRSLRLDIVVVTRTCEIADLAKEYGFRSILHHEPYKSDTVRLGTEALEHTDGIMFVQADQFLVKPSSLGRLIDTYRNKPYQPARLCYGDDVGTPVIFPQAFYQSLKSLEGDRGGGGLLRSLIPDLSTDVIGDNNSNMDEGTNSVIRSRRSSSSSQSYISLVSAEDGYELLDADTPAELEAMLNYIDIPKEHC